jgi:hypothetical protein
VTRPWQGTGETPAFLIRKTEAARAANATPASAASVAPPKPAPPDGPFAYSGHLAAHLSKPLTAPAITSNFLNSFPATNSEADVTAAELGPVGQYVQVQSRSATPVRVEITVLG